MNTSSMSARPTQTSAAGIHQPIAGQGKRLLIPINANEDSRRGVAMTLKRHQNGEAVEVILLHVAEPITQWQVLRSMTRAEVEKFQAERATSFIEEAAEPLMEANIPCRGMFKHGSVIQTILDTANELECDEILVPAPNTGWQRLLSRDVVTTLAGRSQRAKVMLVDQPKPAGQLLS